MKEIYLDNAATTRAYPEVAALMSSLLTEDYGNPSSLHHKGVVSEQHMREARQTLAGLLKAQEKEIFFTSGGTESDNLAIIGGALAAKRRGTHLITTVFEHPAVLKAMEHLASEGFSVTYLPVDEKGRVSAAQIREALREETVLVSVMHVNNEIGSIQPVEEIGAMLKKERPDVLFHVDAVQSFGKLTLIPARSGIDLMSVSGHKIHGPKGIGALYVRKGVHLRPLLFGGAQQEDVRPGTENVPAIAGLGLAARMICGAQKENQEKERELQTAFLARLRAMEGVTINGCPEEGVPGIVNAGFSGVRAEVLLHALEEEGIYVSSGSACASNHPGTSATLLGIGVKEEYLHSSLRFSFSEFTTMEELTATADRIEALLPVLRRFKRR